MFKGWLKHTLVGGLLFLVPILILLVLVKRALEVVQPTINVVADQIPDAQFVGIHLSNVLAVLLLVGVCFVAGLLSTTWFAQQLIRRMESAVLSKVPGYEMIKSMGETLIGVTDDPSRQAVLARVEDSWQIGFVAEEIDDDHVAIVIPNVPSPWSGSLYLMTRDRIRPLDLTVGQAIDCLKRGGYGTADLLRGKIPRFE